MWPGPTLSVYLGRQYLAGAALVLGVLLGLVLLVDLMELLRRAWVRDGVGFWLIVEMAILKLPVMAQKVLPFGSPDEVRAEVRRIIEILGPGGGYVLNSVHNLQSDVPPENIIAIFDEARGYTSQ